MGDLYIQPFVVALHLIGPGSRTSQCMNIIYTWTSVVSVVLVWCVYIKLVFVFVLHQRYMQSAAQGIWRLFLQSARSRLTSV